MILLYVLLVAGLLVATILPGYERARTRERRRARELEAALGEAFERGEL
jgi:hypothetical protein